MIKIKPPIPLLLGESTQVRVESYKSLYEVHEDFPEDSDEFLTARRIFCGKFPPREVVIGSTTRETSIEDTIAAMREIDVDWSEVFVLESMQSRHKDICDWVCLKGSNEFFTFF